MMMALTTNKYVRDVNQIPGLNVVSDIVCRLQQIDHLTCPRSNCCKRHLSTSNDHYAVRNKTKYII